MVKRLPRAWSGHSQCLELRAHILVEENLGVYVTTHHNRAIPDSRVYLSYDVALESPVNQKTVEYKTRQQNMALPSAEANLLIPWGSTGLSVLASCKPVFANMLPVPLVRGEFHFEDLAQ